MPSQIGYLYEEDLYDPATDELTAEDLRAFFGQPPDIPLAGTQPDLDSEWLDTLVTSALKARDALRGLPDDELIRTLPVLRSISSMATARELAVTQELIRRRKPAKWDTGTEEVTGIAREAVQEIALALTLTKYGAENQAQLAKNLQDRLPATFAKMTAGELDAARIKVIAEATSLMDAETARKIDQAIADKAAGMTTGKLRDELRRLEIKSDPESAEKRRQRAERRARVRLYPDSDFTAALCGESLPAELAAAAFARIAAIASAWKAAGAQGSTGLLQAKVFLGLLLGSLRFVSPPQEGGDGPRDDGPNCGGPEDQGTEVREDDEPTGGESEGWPTVPGTAAAKAPGCAELPKDLDIKPGRLKLTTAWRTAAGIGPEPGQLSSLGPITPAQTARLVAAAADDPTVRWTVVVTDDQGLATAVTTIKPKATAGPVTPGMIGEVIIAIPANLAVKGWESGVMDERLERVLRAAARVRPQHAADECSHTAEVPGYRIPGSMRRWVNVRDRTCYNPICRWPAGRCDTDHTLAYEKGGRTCPCNLGPACRAHHQLKQLPGWELTQAKPGHFTLRTRAGLSYTKTPDPYPV